MLGLKPGEHITQLGGVMFNSIVVTNRSPCRPTWGHVFKAATHRRNQSSVVQTCPRHTFLNRCAASILYLIKIIQIVSQ